MADATVRSAARNAAAANDVESRAQWIAARLRHGEIDRRLVEFCARAGDEVCRMFVEVEPADLIDLVTGCRDAALLPRLTRWAHDCARRLVLPMGAEADPGNAAQLLQENQNARLADLALVLANSVLEHGPTQPLIDVIAAYSRRVRTHHRGHMLEAADAVLRAACFTQQSGLPHRSMSLHRRYVHLAHAVTVAYRAQGSKRSEREWQIAHLSRVLLG